MHRLVRDFMESIFANARRNEFALGKARMRESDGAAEDLQEAFERIAEDFPEGGRHAQPLLERSRDVQNGREGLLDLAETLRKPGSLDLLSATPELFDQIGGTLDSIIGSISRISLASRRQSQGANATDAFSQGGAALDRVLSILERIDALMSSGDSSRGVADGIAGRLDSDVRQERRMRVLLLALFLRDMEAADALLQ